MAQISPKVRRIAAASAAVVYITGWVALAVCGAMLWRMHCEGFGCIGKGIAWFAWALGFAAVLVVGYAARCTYRGAGCVALRYLLVFQAVAGVALVIYWVAWRAAQ